MALVAKDLRANCGSCESVDLDRLSLHGLENGSLACCAYHGPRGIVEHSRFSIGYQEFR